MCYIFRMYLRPAEIVVVLLSNMFQLDLVDVTFDPRGPGRHGYTVYANDDTSRQWRLFEDQDSAFRACKPIMMEHYTALFESQVPPQLFPFLDVEAFVDQELSEFDTIFSTEQWLGPVIVLDDGYTSRIGYAYDETPIAAP